MSNFILNFDAYQTVEVLAKNLHCSPHELRLLRTDLRLHTIPKKNKKKGHRQVWSIKNIRFKTLLELFQHYYYDFIRVKNPNFPHPCTHGYLDKRSTLSNATSHIGNRLLLKADIQNFFGSIKASDLVLHFKEMGLSTQVGSFLAEMLTVDGILPQGFCTSPLMSNLIFFELDQQLHDLAKKYNCVYTRYADDITFSSNKILPTLSEITTLLSTRGFELNPGKCIKKKRGQAFFVTGLSISDERPRVPRKWKQRLLQELHYIDRYGFAQHASRANYPDIQTCVNKIAGKVRYLNSISPDEAQVLQLKLNHLLKRNNQLITYLNRQKNHPKKYIIYIDEATNQNKILFLSLVLVEEHDDGSTSQALTDLLTQYRQDDYTTGDTAIKKNSYFHWAESPIDLRRDIVNAIASSDFRCYIGHAYYNGSYESEYYGLFRSLLEQRFKKLDGAEVKIYIEENNLISTRKLEDITNEIYTDAINRSALRPLSPPLVAMIAKGTRINLGLPDITLGVFMDYVKLTPTSPKKTHGEESRFEKLRSKFRYISDFRNLGYNRPFGHNHPIRINDLKLEKR